ncbi:CRISPR-associated RAMP protein Csx7 [uncultured Clostridium sp.]|uniref:type III CRISPR-associated RAMP protein Csx7 n=1 Tax=uncultured Clostridium sp. TaxID=59620 RepID=UPI0025903E4D|nr:CRISPR-associated RAMP protein Csx7 [uncultured Clostridium sp.]MDU1350327.1 CRISPR-associated RAMP protein Csx7 [Clostridium argentinense]
MLKNLKNECIIKFDLLTNGPLLIRDGKASELDPTVPKIQFIKSIYNGELKPVMPGSSIKGVFRSRIERLLYNIDGCRCCDIFDREEGNNCKNNYKKFIQNEKLYPEIGKKLYTESCPACKMFGNLGLKGRVQFKDAFIEDDKYKLGIRTNVGIDRITGAAVKGALFEPEVLEEGNFKCTIKIENYFKWQLKLLLYVLEEINAGYVIFGASTSRGFGNMKIDNFRIISKEFGICEDKFYSEKEFDLDQLKEALKNVSINKTTLEEVELNGQAI